MNRAAHCALHGLAPRVRALHGLANGVLALLALLVLLLAHDATAAPPLTVPHGRLGEPDKGTAPTALWQGAATPPFALETRWDVSGASGTLLRHALAPVPGGIIIAEGVAWDAAAMLPDAGARRLFTADAQGLTVPFTWDALDAAWHGWLALAAAGPDSQGERRLGFLRGERSGEGSLFRRRTAVLGDALHSLPLIVGPPAAAEPGPVYAAFRVRQRARPLAIYLGANDGMLHAFAADSGKELFAYLPRVLGPQVAALASPDYRPRPYVDGSAGAGDVFDGSSWRTLLACGMGMGARGLFALDITDPLQFGRTRGARWEFTERDDPAIGHLRAAPIVARLRTGKRGPLPVDGHFVVLASGINPFNGSADGALFLLRADQDRAKPWTAGASYFRIDTAGADPALPNARGRPRWLCARTAAPATPMRATCKATCGVSISMHAAPSGCLPRATPAVWRNPSCTRPPCCSAPAAASSCCFRPASFSRRATCCRPRLRPSPCRPSATGPTRQRRPSPRARPWRGAP